MLEIIAFDADDTLWHNETHYTRAKHAFGSLLSRYLPADEVERRLDSVEMGNVGLYGYGIKSFTLSMIETAIDISRGRLSAAKVRAVLSLGREMLTSEVHLFEGVEETLATLAASHDLMLITKGDTSEQERKIERSGLAHYFRAVEIVGEKNEATYMKILERHRLDAAAFVMVGNSLKSDILPVLQIGGQAIYIPYEYTWIHEHAPGSATGAGYFEIERLAELPELIRRLNSALAR